MHKRLRETPESGGSSWAAKSIYRGDLFEYGTKLLDSLEWHGPAMVEFKLDRNSDSPVLMELNPKFWGSLDLAIASGVDFPSDTVDVALGKTLAANFEYVVDKHFVWPLEHPIKYLRDQELRASKFQSNLKLLDPLPALYQFFQKLILGFTNKSKLLSNLVYWLAKYDSNGFRSRFIGEIIGVPTKEHCQVTNSIWVGAKPSRLGLVILKLSGFDSRVSLVEKESRGTSSLFPDLMHLPLEEFAAIPTSSLWTYTDKILADQELGSTRIFVHCREGVGRAPAMVSALLMRQGFSLSESLHLVTAGRKVASMNQLQLNSLKAFYEEIRNRKEAAGFD